MEVLADFESCAILAAGILIPNIAMVLGRIHYKRNAITQETKSPPPIHRNRTILSAIGGSLLHRMMSRLRRSRFPKSDFLALVSSLSIALPGEPQIFPCGFERWRALSVRFSLSEYPPSPIGYRLPVGSRRL